MKKIFLIFLMALCNLISVATPVDKYKLLSSLRMTEFYIASGNYEKASTNRDLAMELFRQLGAQNDLNTISMLHKVSHAYSEKGMYKEAIETESLLVDVFPLAQPNNKHDYALYLNDLSFYLMGDDKIELAADYVNKALSLIENTTSVQKIF
ncbi:MAG: tetratricopeptide repeat protein [Bacteroidales bacterium]|nr:tetratricopeptide repeat protein [Bacteroidales bacterium]